MLKGKWTKNPVIVGASIVVVIYYLSRRNMSSGLVSSGSDALRRSQGEGIQWDTGQYVNPSRYQP